MSHNAVYRRALQRAAQVCGGPEALAARLAVPGQQVRSWIDGMEPCPGDVFLAVVDILVDSDLATLRPPPDAHKGDGNRTS